MVRLFSNTHCLRPSLHAPMRSERRKRPRMNPGDAADLNSHAPAPALRLAAFPLRP